MGSKFVHSPFRKQIRIATAAGPQSRGWVTAVTNPTRMSQGWKLSYKSLQGKEVVYVLSINFILGRMPVVWAGDSETILLSYRDGCCNGALCYNHDLADTSAGLGTAVPTSQVL